jgi:lysozyme
MTKINRVLARVLLPLLLLSLALALSHRAWSQSTTSSRVSTRHIATAAPKQILNPQPTISPAPIQQPQVDEKGYQLIRTFEGYSPFEYKDAAGYPTIGFGHLITGVDRITQPLVGAAAEQLFERDVSAATEPMNKLLKTSLSQNQYDALTSFTYNVGTGNLARSSLLRYINSNQQLEVPQQFLLWVKAGGKVNKGLVFRRKQEANLYKSD